MHIRNGLKIAGLAMVILLTAGVAGASHSWGSFHWARTANPFALKLGDNVSGAWDSHLGAASADWSASSVLDTTIVPGTTNPKNCRPTAGRVEVCNAKYGKTGWLGIAQIWVSGSHITKGTTKMNDTYFATANYNTPAWRQFVMCQEVGHTLGLDHQDEAFNNANLGSCMDYTDDPDGTVVGQLSNLHPNQHDYDQLETIYGHVDSVSTLSALLNRAQAARAGDALEDSAEWGKGLRRDHRGRVSLYGQELGRGEKIFTFVIWAE